MTLHFTSILFLQAIHLGKKVQLLQWIAHKRYIGMCTLQHPGDL